MKKSGTAWVALGEGATKDELYFAVEDSMLPGTERKFILYAREILRRLRKMRSSHKTNIALTGEPLTDYDLSRIATCE